jgi:hypothetical protein
MDDILAIWSTQDGSSVQLLSLDSLDRLSEIRRHRPELGEQEQAAIDEFNFANGGDTRHCEISYGPPPIAPEEVVASLAPQVGTIIIYFSFSPYLISTTNDGGARCPLVVLNVEESKKDRKGKWKINGEVEREESGGRWAKFWKGRARLQRGKG